MQVDGRGNPVDSLFYSNSMVSLLFKHVDVGCRTLHNSLIIKSVVVLTDRCWMVVVSASWSIMRMNHYYLNVTHRSDFASEISNQLYESGRMWREGNG